MFRRCATFVVTMRNFYSREELFVSKNIKLCSLSGITLANNLEASFPGNDMVLSNRWGKVSENCGVGKINDTGTLGLREVVTSVTSITTYKYIIKYTNYKPR